MLYYVNDWGESMGAWGSCFATRRRWKCSPFVGQTRKFVKEVNGYNVKFGFEGQHTSDFKENITIDDVRWILRYLGRITDGQFRAALRASGATPAQEECFTRELRARVDQLREVARMSPADVRTRVAKVR